eukprot:CAMPEP_0172591012 /NCGR_PEP_ID=MMETSP1068-20121228/9710_1 /TAXON_ID=35684 /ORGANISM="Pseudopedinella elastica, Strain CCMP716" /LENGTH=48 /DNA_ID= /DNA_START= /DNA_END= /DNA_ORIENTATION=
MAPPVGDLDMSWAAHQLRQAGPSTLTVRWRCQLKTHSSKSVSKGGMSE